MSALLALALLALPARAEATYRMELAGEHVGWARLTLACGDGACRARWESALRAPAEAGGGLVRRELEAETGRDGVARAVRAGGASDGHARRGAAGGAGHVPALLAEVLLAGAGPGERRCLTVRDEESGRVGEACARRAGGWLVGEVLGERVRFRAEPGEAPAEVEVPDQGVRFVADPGAGLPARAPRLFGAAVPADPDSPRFCGLPPDPEPPPAPAAVPRAWPGGGSCRERTRRYLALAGRSGLPGRHAVGVAFDGAGLAWHEWAELRVAGRWIPVDPSFEQAPARGPRFTVARWAEDAPASRAAAGRAVLRCWAGAR